MATERQGAFTIKGQPVTLVGPELKAGDRAPDFHVVDSAFNPVDLAATGSRWRLFSVIPSVDTGICSAQTKRWSDESAKFEDRVAFYSFSRDLPFATKRFCADSGADKITTLSDHMDGNFGKSYGVFVKERGFLSRALFIVDPQGVVRYTQYVPEMATHPDYDAAIAALKELVR
jgi:thioredoxin-dependent peroxiredoxin